jgi:GH25 family lysozyme M1 (1,4-beta-N-acetylmuramidase)
LKHKKKTTTLKLVLEKEEYYPSSSEVKSKQRVSRNIKQFSDKLFYLAGKNIIIRRLKE